jgi:hypothetical protein
MTSLKLGSMMMVGFALLAGSATAGAEKPMSVKRLVLAHGVDGREPQETSTTFRASDDRVYAFVELENPSKTEDAITVVFQPPSGTALPEIPLKVGESARFRTWAFTRRAHDAGEWTVVIRASQGRVLARQTFTVSK